MMSNSLWATQLFPRLKKKEGQTSGKEFTLNDVQHFTDIHKNLISRSILSKKDFRMIFESDKLVFTKGGMYWVRVILLMAYLRPMLL